MIKNGDFVEMDYIGRLKEDRHIFDITDAEQAKKEGVYNPQSSYGSKIICVGEQHIVSGIDTFLVDKECKTYTLTLTPEHAFGKKDAKLLKLIPLSTFHKKNIRPVPGLQLDIDGMIGTIRTISGGRVIVDFNHPLAGRDVEYALHVKRIVTDDAEKLQGLLARLFGADLKPTLDKGKAHIPFSFPEPLQKIISEKITKLIPTITAVTFEEKKTTVPS